MYKIIYQFIGIAFAQPVAPEAKPSPIPDITKSKSQLDPYFSNQIKLDNPGDIASFIYKTILSVAGVVFLLLLLFGAFSYLLGAGNEEKTGKAKKLMVDAVIGVALTASAYAIGQFVIGLLST